MAAEAEAPALPAGSSAGSSSGAATTSVAEALAVAARQMAFVASERRRGGKGEELNRIAKPLEPVAVVFGGRHFC